MQARTLLVVSLFFCVVVGIRVVIFFSQSTIYKHGEQIHQVVRIASEPKVRDRVQKFSVRLKNNTPVWVTTDKFPSLHYGQQITLSGSLDLVTRDNDSFFTMRYPTIESMPERVSFLAVFDLIRQRAVFILNRQLNHIYAALLAGVVMGTKQDMPEAFTSALQTAGVMHVIAASGMNVSMVAGALFLLLLRIVDRRKALIISIGGVFLYICLAGFEPSIVRAGLMAGIASIGALLGRQKVSLYMLLLAASLMLLVSPQLITDVGFQLSVFATAGILVLQPLFVSAGKGRGKLLLHADVTTTLAAQIATLPILLSNFGTFNLLSVLINALILWTIPILMTLGGLGVLVGLIYEPLAIPFFYSSIPFLWYFVTVVTFLSNYPLSISVDVLPTTLTIGYYTLLLAWVLYFQQKQKKSERTGNK